MKFALEKLNIAEAFQAMIGGKFARKEENTDIETLTNKFNNAMTDTASVILSKHRHKKKPWVTTELLDMCDKRRVLKRGRTAPEELIDIELYNSQTKGNAVVLGCPMNTEEDNFPILCEEVEAAVKSLKKSAGVDSIPAELLQAGEKL